MPSDISMPFPDGDDMAENQAVAVQAAERIRSTVYHKSDYRINDIIRRCKKSDVMSLYNIDAMMLFRAEAAFPQFDMLNNHRPYILFHGKAEGVFLPESTGLLFPNMCDELDFRPDMPVDAALIYELSDVEISTLAENGLFNRDWSYQGRVIGAVLEIPCVVDYNAIANTPITFIEIQNRLALHTSTRKTGYKTLVGTFLPYEAQRHNIDNYPKLVEPKPYDRDNAEIRKRAMYDSKAVGFESEYRNPDQDTVSFVEAAQARIHERLQEQMAKSDILENSADRTSKQITEAVALIKDQTDKARKQAIDQVGNDPSRIDAATLDARLDDMANRMIYQGAQAIPLDQAKIEDESLALHNPPGHNDRIMTSPTTNGVLTPDLIIEANKIAREGAAAQAVASINKDNAEANVEKSTDKLHSEVMNSEATIKDIKNKVSSRKEMLAARRQKAIAMQKQMVEAAEAEAAKGLTERGADIERADARKLMEQAEKEAEKEAKIAAGEAVHKPSVLEDDILADLYKDGLPKAPGT